MDSKVKYLLLKTVQNDNILPVTSVCNMSCVFCSHRNNPSGLDVYGLGHLSLELIEELIDYLPEEGSVIIGESASRIIEGDPMTHPEFKKVIKILREKYPLKKIVITTNGSYLDEEYISFLEDMMPLELNISLNCSNPEERVFLMSDREAENIFTALGLLSTSVIPFQGSIVAMPHLIGWTALSKSISLLAENYPETIRVFMPGFTSFSEERLKFSIEDVYRQLEELVGSFSYLEVPVLLEPPIINDFNCYIKGIIRNTPAADTALRKGDIIKKVNGQEVVSRVDAFNQILKSTNPRIDYIESVNMQKGKKNPAKEKLQKIELKKKAGERSGIIVDYDMDIRTIERLTSLLINNKARKIALVTSVLGKGVIKAFISYFYKKYRDIFYNKQIDLVVVENRYFGGSIASAGLLVNNDIINSIKKNGKKYELIVLPGIIYDIFGNDLTGKGYEEIEKSLGFSVEIV
ncbi:MAG: DUF512 domain-containing protein [Bacillota bacterium]